MKPVLHLLSGCTAVGKTEWALRWAEANRAEIVSCDSLLFYRGMDIGTAKPTPAERARVPHHLIDICPLAERMDVASYVIHARRALAEISGRSHAILVVGGSGFYLKAFFTAVTDEVEVSVALRDEVAQLSAEERLERLLALNAGSVGALDVANPRRVTRALERCLASGKTLADLAADFARQPAPFSEWETKLTELTRVPVGLIERIASRVRAMLEAGLVDEVRRLRGEGLEANPSAARAIGYREVIAMLDGKLPSAQLAETIERNTRGLVKKQRTWFRTQLPPHRRVAAEELQTPADLFLS
ncbi:MAG: tRNA (adenosine(37)-N6)-dimethylallyltransferase MiaA, partial [Opitutaceae bacterium]